MGTFIGGPGIGTTVGGITGAVAGGASMDALTTSIDSLVHDEFRPSGNVALIDRIVNGDEHPSGPAFDLGVAILGDVLTGKAVGNIGAKMLPKNVPADPKFPGTGTKLGGEIPGKPPGNMKIKPTHETARANVAKPFQKFQGKGVKLGGKIPGKPPGNMNLKSAPQIPSKLKTNVAIPSSAVPKNVVARAASNLLLSERIVGNQILLENRAIANPETPQSKSCCCSN